MITFTINGQIILQNTTTGKWADIHIADVQCLESLYGFVSNIRTKSFKLIEILDHYYEWEKQCLTDEGTLNTFGNSMRTRVIELIQYIDELRSEQPNVYAFIQDKIYQEDEDIDYEDDFDEDLAYEDDVLRSVGYF
jgi:hypothetical protein